MTGRARWAELPGTAVVRVSLIDLAVLIDATRSFVHGTFTGRRGPQDVDDAWRLLRLLERTYVRRAREEGSTGELGPVD